MDLLAVVGLGLAAIGAVAAVIVVWPTLKGSRPATVEVNLDRFKTRYAQLRQGQVMLGDRMLEKAPAEWRDREVPMLATPGWLFDAPEDLSSVVIERASHDGDPQHLVERSRVFKGLNLAGPSTYSEAIFQANPASEYFPGTIYRPTSVRAGDNRLTVTLERGQYFDYLDTSEVLAFEAILGDKGLGLRRGIADPFDLTNRVASLGILTLTVCTSAAGATFLMHKRSGQYVVGDALYHVVPAGEFAPSDLSLAAIDADFDLWRNITREFAEELLGLPDAQGQGGRRLDYENATPYRELNAAKADSDLRVRTFGIGLDPLTLKPELLTVVVIASSTFEQIFPSPLPRTPEGTVVEGIPFTVKNVEDYVTSASTRHGAKAVLKLAWKHREELGIE